MNRRVIFALGWYALFFISCFAIGVLDSEYDTKWMICGAISLFAGQYWADKALRGAGDKE